jgi:DNA-binding transcriptional regulator YhcF (GntR family)
MTDQPLTVVVDPTSTEPPYDQIRTQITRLVDSGSLAPGAKLPTVRALAQELHVAANTVARAYRELEHRGVISTRGRLGTFVSGRSVDRAAKQAAADFVKGMRALDLDDEAILDHVRRGLAPPKSS